jgi:lipopolysaccharide transport system permease protein
VRAIFSQTRRLARKEQRLSVSAPGEMQRVIEPVRGVMAPPIRHLAHYGDLLYFLARRDVAVRYKQTAVGIAWTVLQPVLFALIFSLFLGELAKVPSGNAVPYPVFAVTGLTLWIFFTSVLVRTSDSLVSSAGLLSKVYFPRLILPLAAALPPLVDFTLAFVVALITMVAFGVIPAPMVVLVLIPLLLALTLALGAGLWMSALNVRYRDVGLLVPVIIQAGLFVTPIIYPASLVPSGLRALYSINPLVGIFELYRWTIFTEAPFPVFSLVVSIAVAAALLLSGTMYFQRAEAAFADVV